MPEVYFTSAEAAAYLKVTQGRILDLIEEGRFPGAFKIGRNWRIPAEAVISFQRWPHRGKKRRRKSNRK